MNKLIAILKGVYAEVSMSNDGPKEEELRKILDEQLKVDKKNTTPPGQPQYTEEQLKRIFKIAKDYEEKGRDVRPDLEGIRRLTGEDVKDLSRNEKKNKPGQ